MNKFWHLTAVTFALVGCTPEVPKADPEILRELNAIKAELAAKKAEPVRWALADKRKIETEIMQWSRGMLEQAKRAEKLSPEMEAKVRIYEGLEQEFSRKHMEILRNQRGYIPAPELLSTNKELAALSEKMNAAKAEVADVVEKRGQLSKQYDKMFSVEGLIADYVGDRFDVVVDSDPTFSRFPVLYRKDAETVDITEGILKLFREKSKTMQLEVGR